MWERVRQEIQKRQRRALTRERHAAVLLPVIDDGAEPRVILTRRTNDLSTHKGQVAYPGGIRDAVDLSSVHTALREAQEEVGLAPELVEVLGSLDDFPTIHNNVSVTPVVGLLREEPVLTPEPSEVARIFQIPLGFLQDPSSWEVKEMERYGMVWPVFYCRYDGETLWGLSAYITMQFLDLLPGGAPFALPEHRLK